jgi:hypothetical protein
MKVIVGDMQSGVRTGSIPRFELVFISRLATHEKISGVSSADKPAKAGWHALKDVSDGVFRLPKYFVGLSGQMWQPVSQ